MVSDDRITREEQFRLRCESGSAGTGAFTGADGSTVFVASRSTLLLSPPATTGAAEGRGLLAVRPWPPPPPGDAAPAAPAGPAPALPGVPGIPGGAPYGFPAALCDGYLRLPPVPGVAGIEFALAAGDIIPVGGAPIGGGAIPPGTPPIAGGAAAPAPAYAGGGPPPANGGGAIPPETGVSGGGAIAGMLDARSGWPRLLAGCGIMSGGGAIPTLIPIPGGPPADTGVSGGGAMPPPPPGGCTTSGCCGCCPMFRGGGA